MVLLTSCLYRVVHKFLIVTFENSKGGYENYEGPKKTGMVEMVLQYAVISQPKPVLISSQNHNHAVNTPHMKFISPTPRFRQLRQK